MAEALRRLVIAIDFGTTFSGVAWAFNTNPDDVNHIQTWPGENTPNEVSDKVPTRLLRRGAGRAPWGWLIPRNAERNQVFRCFKLKLDARPEAAEIAGPAPIQHFNEAQVDELIFEYILQLVTYLKQYLTRRYGPGFMAQSDVHYVFTVPAIWSPRATQRTKRAFERALGPGLVNPILDVSEPEAAANCVLQRVERQIIRPNESFMVLDAGGGTVDLISYVLRQAYPLSVEEVVAGSGDFSGGATVTHRFEEWLRSKVGHDDDFDDDLAREAIEEFDTMIKPSINSAALASNTVYHVRLPGLNENPGAGIHNERLSITAGDIVTFFQPSFERIKLLVAQQIAAANVPIRTIIMVGGYGQSQYLREELEAEELIQQRGISIHQPRDAWTAVVEGAVMYGLSRVAPLPRNGAVARWERIARRHYGIELAATYHEGLHAPLLSKRRWDGLAGRWEVDVMSLTLTLVHQGDAVAESRPYLTDFSITCRVNYGQPASIVLIVYEDELSEAGPLARTGNENDNVRELCTVEADLRQIPENQVTQRRGTDGFMYYYLDGRIEAVYGGGTVAYTLIYNGQRYNTVHAEFH